MDDFEQVLAILRLRSVCYSVPDNRMVEAEDYYYLKEHRITSRQEMEQELQGLRTKERLVRNQMKRFEEIAENLEVHLNIKKYDRKLVEELVERIVVDASGKIEIVFKSEDVFQMVEGLLEDYDSVLHEAVHSGWGY